jgi:hypothetical protein
MAIEVLLDLELESSVKHPPRTLQAELIQRAPRLLVLPFGLDLDTVRHRWRVLPLWPQGPRLIAFQTEEYAAFFMMPFHNLWS